MDDPLRGQIERAAGDLARSKYAIALTGAGISTESGIPDFRGPSGVWTKNPGAERKSYRSYQMFLEDPAKWWEDRLSRPGVLGDLENAKPNAGHLALAELEALGVIKCVVTQNVDGLHEKAGTNRIIEYHGSALKLRCMACGSRYGRDAYDLRKLQQEGKLPPICPACGGIVKTDGVAFGEPIPQDVVNQSALEASKCDLMLICGTSAVVYPFANLPILARKRRNTKIIEVNAAPTPLTEMSISDYLIKGNTGDIIPEIVKQVRARRKMALH